MRNSERTAPDHLTVEGAELWAKIATEFDLDDPAGELLLTTACECYDLMKAAQAIVATGGIVVQDRWGIDKENPAVTTAKNARAHMLMALKALRLDVEPIQQKAGA